MSIHFDREADFLEVRFGDDEPNYGEHVEDDTFAIRSKQSDELLGYAFHNVSKHTTQDLDVEIPETA